MTCAEHREYAFDIIRASHPEIGMMDVSEYLWGEDIDATEDDMSAILDLVRKAIVTVVIPA